jgi:transmembrane sensor
LALSLSALIFTLSDRDRSYKTAVGEQKAISLSDGSRIMLDTASSVRVHYEPEARYVVLQEGQAYFEVAPDAHRPFTVTAANGTVTAVGTAFSVRRDGDAVTVVLVKGTVAVTATTGAHDQAVPDGKGGAGTPSIALKAGEQVAYNARGVDTARPTDTGAAINWTHGDIVFRSTPLSQAVAEINRYSSVRLTVNGPNLADQLINGVFHVDDVDTFLLALEESFGIKHQMVSHDVVVLAR